MKVGDKVVVISKNKLVEGFIVEQKNNFITVKTKYRRITRPTTQVAIKEATND